MTTYRVTWEIDIEAKSAKEAAKQALFVQRDPYSTATVFDVAYDKITGKGPKKKSAYVHEKIDLS
jgi:hypothetical protein